MTTTVKAIFEGGLLRPLTPLELREGEEVDMTVRSRQEAAAPDPEYIEQLLAEFAAAYEPTGQGETASVDHDENFVQREGGAMTFVDTGGWFAFAVTGDANHASAALWMRNNRNCA